MPIEIRRTDDVAEARRLLTRRRGFEETELSLWINGVPVYDQGAPTAFDAAALSADIRANRDVHLRLRFARGDAEIRFWTCDLTAEYVRLNADYTT